MHSEYVVYAVLALVAARLLFVVAQTYISPLRSVKGPFLARLTRLYYFNRVAHGSFEFENIELHRKYGDVVRLGPNMYSINDPEVVKAVYGIGSKFAKSDWYESWKHPAPERWSMFTIRDIKKHSDERRKYQAMYSMSSLVHYEPYVNECLDLFDQRMKETAEANRTINMAHWVQCYAFDVIAGLTYSKRFGFLDAGQDIGGLMAMLENVLRYSTLVGIFAWLHPILWSLTASFKATGAGARAQLNGHLQRWLDAKSDPGDIEKRQEKTEDDLGAQDFIDKLLIANSKDPQKISMWNVFTVGMTNIIAGSDTTAATISGILYHVLQNPDKLKKLREEIDDWTANGKLSHPVQFKEAQQMPYLQAVMKEGMRLHSAVGLPLWRTVPAEGLRLGGRFFPPGTEVGLNAWVAHYNPDVFDEPYAFRPERWIEAEKGDNSKLKEMDGYFLPFGLGARTCIGRHISILEMSKLIPELLRAYDLELAGSRPWETVNWWFVKPKQLSIKVKSRASQ